MVSLFLSVGSLAIGASEIVGFFGIYQYLVVLGIPIHPNALQLLEFPSYCLEALVAAPLASNILIFLVLFPSLLVSIVSTSRTLTASVVYYRSRQDIDQVTYLLKFVQGFFDDWLFPLRAIQIACLFLALFIALAAASAWGGTESYAALQGLAPGILRDTNARASVNLVAMAGHSLPKSILKANDIGALALLWQDDQAFYVAPVHDQSKLPRAEATREEWFMHWVAIQRSQISSLKYSRQLLPGDHFSHPNNSFWVTVFNVVAIVYLLALSAVIIRIAGREHNERIQSAFSTLSFEQLKTLEVAPETARAILRALTRGQDCILQYRKDKEIYRAWIRREMFPEGIAIAEIHVEAKSSDHHASPSGDQNVPLTRPADRI